MSGYPVAFVDEAYIHRRGHAGVYLLAAVLAEGDDLDTLTAAARTAARGGPYHSVELYHRGHVGVVEDMLDAVERHAAWTAVVAHAPLGASEEIARQTALRQLLSYLDRQRVRDVVLDVRGDTRQWQDAREQGLKFPAVNYADIRSYRHMVTARQISSRMRLMHVDDRGQPGLWMADAVAWSARRTLAADEPQWWLRVASAATVIEATTGGELRLEDNRAAPPVGDHGPHSMSQSAHATLLPARRPHQVYPDIETGGDGRGQAGSFLTSLIAQADAVRAGHHPATAEQQQRVLAEVMRLAQRVDQLTNEIHELKGNRDTDNSPSVTEPESELELHAGGDAGPQPADDGTERELE